MLILVGSSLHNLCDGVLVAAAFLTDPLLGVLTAASIIVHEVPHKLGDFVVLLNAGLARRRAFALILFTSLCSALGGIIGYFVLQQAQDWVPYVLVVAASSFLYISVADLMPVSYTHLRSRLPAAASGSNCSRLPSWKSTCRPGWVRM